MTAYVTYDDISVTLDNLVATIEIQRPPHNFFDIALINQIADVLEKLDADGDCRASVLCAEGKAFCAGANFGDGEALIFFRSLYTDPAYLKTASAKVFSQLDSIIPTYPIKAERWELVRLAPLALVINFRPSKKALDIFLV